MVQQVYERNEIEKAYFFKKSKINNNKNNIDKTELGERSHAIETSSVKSKTAAIL